MSNLATARTVFAVAVLCLHPLAFSQTGAASAPPAARDGNPATATRGVEGSPSTVTPGRGASGPVPQLPQLPASAASQPPRPLVRPPRTPASAVMR